MAFRVEVEPRAAQDLDTISEHIKTHSSFDVAERWLNGVIKAIASLSEMPYRNPLAPEAAEVGRDVRVLLHGRKPELQGILHSNLGSTFGGCPHSSRASLGSKTRQPG
jgi:plasmid stabilization system protein ParE